MGFEGGVLMDVKKGQTAWISRGNRIEETTISSVGRQYVTVEWDKRIKFNADTLVQVDSHGIPYFIILDIEKYNRDKYYSNLISEIKSFDWHSIGTEKLDEIAILLNIANNLKEDR
jgi:hypothetical protein